MDSNEHAAKADWTEVVAAKRAIQDRQLQKYYTESRHLDSHSLGAHIVDIEALTGLLRSGQASTEELIRAYIGRACEAQKKVTNCLTEICFDEAIDQARLLDKYQRTHGRLIGPLHGVPITVKDQFNIQGLDSTLGYVANAFTPAESDAPLLHTLKQLGAIIIAKTNLPQSIMWCETDNPLWGLTTHPANPKYTPGGSSGGEAALLALGGSLSGRMSYRGVMATLDGQQHVPSAVGPMARSLSSLIAVTRLAITAAPWTIDPQLPPIPWRDEIFEDMSTRSLVIGAMLDDGVVTVHPPIEQTFCELVVKLKAAGHEVVEWDSSLNSKCIEVMDEYYASDGGEDIRRAVATGGEPLIPQIQAFVNRGPPISVYEYWQINKRKVAYQQAYHDMWDTIRSASGRAADVLLVPTMPHTAVPHGCCRWTGYTKLFNFLDYTALTFPAGKVSKDLAKKYTRDRAPRNALDAWNCGLYNPSEMDGHSIGLQIVGRRFEEEKVLGAARQIQELL
ncbi:hypothetical protein NM208_g9725 [Fusarium decemcellulare]|uniref:Uncharacterized protein n=2 Tax=Fusarium decemcellulare TaxID=57161 RepID=A0ACC1RWR9_9HYPO|nr:hypothetical protein NM208_g10756 [Fusarium decemcellulare]KAJ3529514.1 hypothetical protein NM208_g9725 [Fusarium decemcellulare]